MRPKYCKSHDYKDQRAKAKKGYNYFKDMEFVRDGGSSNTRLDLDQAHSYDVGVLLATLTYYSDSKQIVV